MYLNDSRIQRYGVIVLGVVMASMLMLVLPFQETSTFPGNKPYPFVAIIWSRNSECLVGWCTIWTGESFASK
jgi:hypothetical protein